VSIKLTVEEKRNLEVVKEWAKAWDTDAARMVDEIYADATEVFTPLQNIYWVRQGKSKEYFRTVEVEELKRFKSRKMKFVTMIARGDTVALEVTVTRITKQGESSEGWAAAFLKFNEDGKIVSDHTFMAGPQLSKEGRTLVAAAAMEKILEDNR
jgi:ketosteroid isomerase-like protein